MQLKYTLITLLVCVGSGAIQAQSYFRNPVIPGDFADPTIIRIENTYYASGTSSEWAPHYPIFESQDLINWEYVGPAFAKKPDWTKASFWAPELYVLNDKIYLYYTARRASDGISFIGVAVTDDIRKGFQDKGCLVEFGKEAIDAFVFEDQGVLYMTWKAYGLDDRPIELLCSELSPDGLQLVGEPFMLLRDNERIGLEGQYIYKEGDYYYILYSIRSCCGSGSDYAVSVARSKTLNGPYELYSGNPILTGDDKKVLSCGHGTAVQTPDNRMFYLYHAYLKGKGFYNGRQAFLTELALNDDQWPYFVKGKEAAMEETIPFPQVEQKKIADFEDNFNDKTLRPEWCWNFVYSTPQTTIQNGSFFLTGKANEGNRYGTAFCVRSLQPGYDISTEITSQPGICHGLTLYGDQENLVIWGRENQHLVLKRIQKGKEEILYSKKQRAATVYIKITVIDGCQAIYQWSTDEKKWHTIQLNAEQQEIHYLPPWDRAYRPGIIHTGDETIPAEFRFFRVNYKETYIKRRHSFL